MWKNNKLAQWEDGTVSWRPPIDMWLVHVTYVLLIKNSETEQKNTTVVFAIWQIITTFWANITYSSSFSKRRNFTHQPLHKLESWLTTVTQQHLVQTASTISVSISITDKGPLITLSWVTQCLLYWDQLRVTGDTRKGIPPKLFQISKPSNTGREDVKRHLFYKKLSSCTEGTRCCDVENFTVTQGHLN